MHFEVQADDIERAKNFYEKVFDWKIEKMMAKEDGGMDYWGLKTGPDGFKGVSITNTPIVDRINKQTAPSGVDFVNRVIKIYQPDLIKDIAELPGKGIQLPNGDVTHDVTEYINSLVNFEKQHLFNTTIDDLNILRNGTQAEKDALVEDIDRRAVQTYTEEFPPKQSVSNNSPAIVADEAYRAATQDLRPDMADTIEPLNRVLDGRKETPLSERVGALDYFRTPWKVFDKMGIRPSYETLLQGYNNYVHELPINIDKITAWAKGVSEEDNVKIFDFLDGQDVELSPRALQTAKEIKSWLGQWADRLGMDHGDRITDYITHIFPANKGGEIPEEIASLIRDKTPGSVYDPFLLQRQGAKGYYHDTWKALDAYVKRATRKVNMDPGLAAIKEASLKLTESTQLDYLNSYLGRVNMRPSRLDTLIDNSIKSLFGYKFGVRPTATITRSLRMMISRAKIGGSITSFAKNLTQGINTFSDLGAVYTTRGYADLVKFGGKELEEHGVLAQPFIEDRTYSAIKKWSERFDKVLFANMNASELVNRGAAYYGAKAKLLNGKVTPKEFREGLGRTMPTDYKPNLQDAIDYGKFVAGKTQFQFGALDTPVALNSDLAKTLAQFQTFGLKQAEFIAHMAKNKDWAKLIRYVAGSMLLFNTIGSAFGMSWKDTFNTMRFGMPPAGQFLSDLYTGGVMGTDKYGRKLTPSERVGVVGKTIFTNVMPAGAQINRTLEGLGTVGAGKSTTGKGTFQYKVKKTPENYVSGALFGKYNIPESQTYYQKQQDKLSGVKTKATNKNRYNAVQ